MKYTYYAIVYHGEKETLFFFADLPSGILTIEKGEEEKEVLEDTLIDLLSDEDFLPHDLLPPSHQPTEEEVKKMISILNVPYEKDKIAVKEVQVEDE